MSSTDTLDARADALAAQGADPLRVELVRRARRFKRTWIEMAEALIEVRMKRSYEVWGYADFFTYCNDELLIKRRTVEKLTGSYQTLQQHAPDVLSEESEPPSFEAVDYYSRALDRVGLVPDEGVAPVNDPPEALEELRQAVFDDNRPVSSLRRQFHDVLFKKSDDEAQRERLEKAHTAANRLMKLLPELELSGERVGEVAAALENLQRDLEPMLAAAREEAPRKAG